MAAPGPTDAAIRFEHVEKRFPGAARPAVTDLSLDVPEGELVAFVGPSGCGKTTSLRMINRLEEPTGGTIAVGGRDARSVPAAELRRGIGYVIQQTGLFPHRTIAANIATVPELLGWDKERTRLRVEELVELVGLDPELLGRYPAALSGGQQQRVGVARALAADPPVLLMDEPYSAVDPIVRARLQDELLALQRRLRKTVVFVTHDIDEAIKLADRIAILNVGGVLEQYDAPADLLRTPANAFVESFLGRERALRRMALLTVADIGLADGAGRAGHGVGRRRSASHGGAPRRLGRGARRPPHARLGRRRRVSTATPGSTSSTPKKFVAWVAHHHPLREALDTIVSSRTRVAVVLEADDYRGMVTIDDIAEAMAR